MNYLEGGPMWLDVLNGACAVVVAAAAAVTAVFAARGLNAWRSELSGRRKYELAEEVLLALRELDGLIAWIRSPVSTEDEQAEFVKGDNESSDDFHTRKMYSTAWLRYSKRQDFFEKFKALQFRAAVILDEQHEKPLADAVAVVDDVLQAGYWAANFARQYNEQVRQYQAGFTSRMGGADWAAKMHEQEDVYWGTGKDDPTKLRLTTAIAQAQALYRPILLGKK